MISQAYFPSKMVDDKFLLSWNDFAANAPNTFRNLWTDQDFTDVTLATEDNQQIRKHKVILSSCSQFDIAELYSFFFIIFV